MRYLINMIDTKIYRVSDASEHYGTGHINRYERTIHRTPNNDKQRGYNEETI